MLRMDMGSSMEEARFLARFRGTGMSDQQLEAGAKAASWGYNHPAICSAIRAGCDDPYEIANWCDTNATGQDSSR